MRAVILGSGGWMPAEGREAACVLLRRDDSAVLLDAGTGCDGSRVSTRISWTGRRGSTSCLALLLDGIEARVAAA